MATINVGGTNTNVNAQQINFSDGSVQVTSAGFLVAPTVGTAIMTGTSVSVPFTHTYVGTASPVVLLTPYSQAPAYWVTFTGSAGAWTAFTINTASSFFGAFNYGVFGQPN